MLTHAHLTGSLHPWAGLTRAHIFIHVWALRCLDLREHPLTHTSIPQSIAHAHSYRHLPPHDYPWTHILAPHSCSHTLTQASVCTCTYTRVVACSLHMHTQHTLMSTCVVTCVHTHAYEDIDQAGCRVERGWGGEQEPVHAAPAAEVRSALYSERSLSPPHQPPPCSSPEHHRDRAGWHRCAGEGQEYEQSGRALSPLQLTAWLPVGMVFPGNSQCQEQR